MGKQSVNKLIYKCIIVSLKVASGRQQNLMKKKNSEEE